MKRKMISILLCALTMASVNGYCINAEAKVLNASEVQKFQDVEKEQKLQGWQVIDGEKYFYNEDGTKVRGWQIIDGQRYYFSVEGKLQLGCKL